MSYRPKSDTLLTQSIALEESPLPGVLHTSITVIGSLMAVFLLWSAFTTVEEVAAASGQVVPRGYIQNIQHLDGGIVREIYVHDGDLVQKGKPLFRFDATDADADLGQMKARQTALESQAARFRAFTARHPDKKSSGKLTVEEQAILSSMVDARTNQQKILRNQISQKEKEAAALASMRSAIQKSVDLKQQENKLFQETVESGSSSKLMALSSERELNEVQGRLAEVIIQERQAKDAVDEATSRLTSLDTDLRQEAMKQLGQTEAELAELNKSIGRQEGAANRTILTAPVTGVVKGLTVHTLGAVVEAGKVLMEVVPIDEELVVEAMVSPNDIGNVKEGQNVEIKVSAFDFSRFGSVPGRLKNISASTFQDEDGNSFYKARITMERNYVGKDSKRNRILPGMTVQANITTGEKTILQYLLKPIQNATQGAFHER